ncbi:unnamed protein product [Allacma fusca]|uniref:Uncharacterized protein n=1 Tax=Allacma fusca TaxID=39272 RepID=A0A8J2K037_9HEXA|nr:unnamed protein product [Allacma fusca]
MKDNVVICIFTVAVIALATLSVEVASFPMQDSNGGPLSGSLEPAHKGTIGIPDNRSRAFMQLYLLSLLEKLGTVPNERTRIKKTCLLNAGLSHSCDYRDALAAIDEGNYLGSELTPGRK